MQHLDALYLRRSNEISRLAAAKTQAERELRTVWLASIDSEIAGERDFLGMQPDLRSTHQDLEFIDEDELLAQLCE